MTEPFTVTLKIDPARLNTMIDQRIRETLDAGKVDASPKLCGEIGLLQTDSDSYMVLICAQPAGHDGDRHLDANVSGLFPALRPLTRLVRAARAVAEDEWIDGGEDIRRELGEAADAIDPGRKVK